MNDWTCQRNCWATSQLWEMRDWVCQGWHPVMEGVWNCVPFVDVSTYGCDDCLNWLRHQPFTYLNFSFYPNGFLVAVGHRGSDKRGSTWMYIVHSYLFWALCELRVLNDGLKTVPRSLRVLMRTLLGFSCNNRVGVPCIVTLHLDYWARAVQTARNDGEVLLPFFVST